MQVLFTLAAFTATAFGQDCVYDGTDDGQVDVQDLLGLLGEFGSGADAGWSYLGCFVDSGNRDLGAGPTGVAQVPVDAANECAALCDGFAYFGLQWVNECFCDNEYGEQGEGDIGDSDSDGTLDDATAPFRSTPTARAIAAIAAGATPSTKTQFSQDEIDAAGIENADLVQMIDLFDCVNNDALLIDNCDGNPTTHHWLGAGYRNGDHETSDLVLTAALTTRWGTVDLIHPADDAASASETSDHAGGVDRNVDDTLGGTASDASEMASCAVSMLIAASLQSGKSRCWSSRSCGIHVMSLMVSCMMPPIHASESSWDGASPDAEPTSEPSNAEPSSALAAEPASEPSNAEPSSALAAEPASEPSNAEPSSAPERPSRPMLSISTEINSLWEEVEPIASIVDTDRTAMRYRATDFSEFVPGWGEDNSEVYVMRWRGGIVVSQSGTHRFQTISDDGNMVFINGQLVIDNDGVRCCNYWPVMIDNWAQYTPDVRMHGQCADAAEYWYWQRNKRQCSNALPRSAEGEMYLSSGTHHIVEITYFTRGSEANEEFPVYTESEHPPRSSLSASSLEINWSPIPRANLELLTTEVVSPDPENTACNCECAVCERGKHDHDWDPATACAECPDGATSRPGETACGTPCQPGAFQNVSEPPSEQLCTPCVAGRYDHDADPFTPCSVCPTGKVTAPHSTPSTNSSCHKNCGHNALGCYCDEACSQLGDCCSDYGAQCQSNTDGVGDTSSLNVSFGSGSGSGSGSGFESATSESDLCEADGSSAGSCREVELQTTFGGIEVSYGDEGQTVDCDGSCNDRFATAAWDEQELIGGDAIRGIRFRMPSRGYKIVGFTSQTSTEVSSYRDFDYCMFLQYTEVYVYESGSYRGYFGRLQTEGVYEVRWNDDEDVEYVLDGEVFYTSRNSINWPLHLQVSYYYVPDFTVTDLVYIDNDGEVPSYGPPPRSPPENNGTDITLCAMYASHGYTCDDTELQDVCAEFCDLCDPKVTVRYFASSSAGFDGLEQSVVNPRTIAWDDNDNGQIQNGGRLFNNGAKEEEPDVHDIVKDQSGPATGEHIVGQTESIVQNAADTDTDGSVDVSVDRRGDALPPDADLVFDLELHLPEHITNKSVTAEAQRRQWPFIQDDFELVISVTVTRLTASIAAITALIWSLSGLADDVSEGDQDGRQGWVSYRVERAKLLRSRRVVRAHQQNHVVVVRADMRKGRCRPCWAVPLFELTAVVAIVMLSVVQVGADSSAGPPSSAAVFQAKSTTGSQSLHDDVYNMLRDNPELLAKLAARRPLWVDHSEAEKEAAVAEAWSPVDDSRRRRLAEWSAGPMPWNTAAWEKAQNISEADVSQEWNALHMSANALCDDTISESFGVSPKCTYTCRGLQRHYLPGKEANTTCFIYDRDTGGWPTELLSKRQQRRDAYTYVSPTEISTDAAVTFAVGKGRVCRLVNITTLVGEESTSTMDCLVDGEHTHEHTVDDDHFVEISHDNAEVDSIRADAVTASDHSQAVSDAGTTSSGPHSQAGGATNFTVGACTDILVRVNTTQSNGQPAQWTLDDGDHHGPWSFESPGASGIFEHLQCVFDNNFTLTRNSDGWSGTVEVVRSIDFENTVVIPSDENWIIQGAIGANGLPVTLPVRLSSGTPLDPAEGSIVMRRVRQSGHRAPIDIYQPRHWFASTLRPGIDDERAGGPLLYEGQ
eukprot:SAG22_NODE_353_length_11812_cov_58.910783_7_plen_1690_part_00